MYKGSKRNLLNLKYDYVNGTIIYIRCLNCYIIYRIINRKVVNNAAKDEFLSLFYEVFKSRKNS